jgi:hypothetical protein
MRSLCLLNIWVKGSVILLFALRFSRVQSFVFCLTANTMLMTQRKMPFVGEWATAISVLS